MSEEYDDGVPTPRTTGSYALFRDESFHIAAMLDEVVIVTRKRIDLYDKARLDSATSLAKELRALGKRFAAWPELDIESVAKERAELVPRMTRAMRAAVDVLEQMPSRGTLGRVHKPDH